ncbi:MAG TPA: SNF2-related protein [Verrucomicrobiales bacterium]|nr:SNF2-related protein [Verrucomicrobiales bacterium]
MTDFQINEKWLGETAGWKALREGRRIEESGAVQRAARSGPSFSGSVIEGRRTLRAGLVARTRSDVENLCPCRDSRSTGALCAHSVAVVLAVLRSEDIAKIAPKNKGKKTPETPAAGAGKAIGGAGPRLPRTFQIRFTGDWEKLLPRGRLSVSVTEPDADPSIQDHALREWLARAGVARVPVALLLDGGTAPEFLACLAGHPRVTRGEERIQVLSIPVRPVLLLEESAGAAAPDREITLRLLLPDNCAVLGAGAQDAGYWLWLGDRRCFAPLGRDPGISSAELQQLVAAGSPGARAFHRSRSWVARRLESLQALFRLESSGLGALPAVRRIPPALQLTLEGSLNHLAGKLVAVYGERKVVCGHGAEGFPAPDPETPGSFLARDVEAEQEALGALRQAGFTEPDASGQLALPGEGQVLRFFASVLPRLKAAGWTVLTGSRFAALTRQVQVIRPVLEVRGREAGWLDVDIGYAGEDGTRLPRDEVLRLLRGGRADAGKGDRRRWVVDEEACAELEEVLRDVDPEQREGRFRIEAVQEGYLAEAVGLRDPDPGAAPLLLDEETLRGELWERLRVYQREGVQWLCRRAKQKLGGVLADEMGLGKTVQVLTYMAWLHRRPGGESKGSLVICPTSLLGNWAAEARRFVPELPVHTYHGSGRELPGEAFDGLLLTTYGILLQDGALLRRRSWRCAVLDEATAIKNPDTRTARAARRLTAALRVAVTGTPVENTVRELWSLLEFVCPGYLGSRQDFRVRYELPLSADPPPAAAARRFHHRIAPFLLRRTKREVARDLPERIEQVRSCELHPAQRNLYTAILRAGREAMEAETKGGQGAVRMLMLTTLLRLRQVCCDPRLVEGDATRNDGPAQPKATSGKLDALGELLDEAFEGGHRVLLFSQFVGQLRLLREWSAERGWPYCYLDGQTAGRAAEVDRFQSDASIPLFLISLKAGGYGLNLTAADTVVLYDPWWNPAVERQAADRAHRIGQGRTVAVYRLIAKGTVEEKILELQRRKNAVIDVALDDQRPVMSGLRDDDLRELLQ